MTMAMIYGIVFLIEALIAFQYFEWMFVKPRYTVIKRFVLICTQNPGHIFMN